MLNMHNYEALDFVTCSCVFRSIVTGPKCSGELWISVSQRQVRKEPSLTGRHYVQIRTPAKLSLISAWGGFLISHQDNALILIHQFYNMKLWHVNLSQ